MILNAAKIKPSNENEFTSVDVEINQVTAPLESDAACEVESLLLKILEYGNYSFH